MPALTMRGRYLPGTAMSVRSYYRDHEEPWVTSAVVDGLLERGFRPTEMFIEMLLAQGSRPDLVAVHDASRTVLIFEAKRGAPASTERRQLRRYAAHARTRWPGYRVLAFLVWPRQPRTFVTHVDELGIEELVA